MALEDDSNNQARGNPNGGMEENGEAAPVPPPAYLTRLATLAPAPQPQPAPPVRPDSARIDQIEHALTILASVVARFAKEAQQARQWAKAIEADATQIEERRQQRELLHSLQARLIHLEERLERERQSRLAAAPSPRPPAFEQEYHPAAMQSSLEAIRKSLEAISRRRNQRIA